jgi:hypothetical protein
MVMESWLSQNGGVVLTLLAWFAVSLLWASNQKSRIDVMSERVSGWERVVETLKEAHEARFDGWEKAAGVNAHALEKRLTSIDDRLRAVTSQLDRLLGAQHGRRVTDRVPGGGDD